MNHLKLRKTNCKLNNLNLRKELHGENQVLAADLTVVMNMTSSVLDDMAIEDGIPWENFLWGKDGSVRGHGIEKFGINREFEDHKVLVVVDKTEMEFEDITVKKIVVEPEGGKRVSLQLTIQVHPTEKQVAMLSEAIMGSIAVKIDPPRQSDLVDATKTKGDEDEG